MHDPASTTAEHDQSSPECRYQSELPAKTESFKLLDLIGDEDIAHDAMKIQSAGMHNTHVAKWGSSEEEYEVEGIIGHEMINGTAH